MSTDYYAVLGIPETATREEIKKVYRALAKIYHPDSGITKDEEKFKGIQAAYDVLSDPTRRAAYDAERTSGPSTNGSAPEPEPPPAPDKSEWTAAEWKAYWQFGGTDLPGTWTDALRQAYRECGGTPPPTPEEEARIRQEEATRQEREREKRKAAQARQARAERETREREARERVEREEWEVVRKAEAERAAQAKREAEVWDATRNHLLALLMGSIGPILLLIVLSDPHHGVGIFNALSGGLEMNKNHATSADGAIFSLPFLLLTLPLGLAAMVVFPGGLLLTTGACLWYLVTREDDLIAQAAICLFFALASGALYVLDWRIVHWITGA